MSRDDPRDEPNGGPRNRPPDQDPQRPSPPPGEPGATDEGADFDSHAQPWRRGDGDDEQGVPRRLEHGIWHAPQGPVTKLVAVVVLVTVTALAIATVIAAIQLFTGAHDRQATWGPDPDNQQPADEPQDADAPGAPDAPEAPP